jgi:hypothetical protein
MILMVLGLGLLVYHIIGVLEDILNELKKLNGRT